MQYLAQAARQYEVNQKFKEIQSKYIKKGGKSSGKEKEKNDL